MAISRKIPEGDERVGNEKEELGSGRQGTAPYYARIPELGYQVKHQESGRGQYHRPDEGGIDMSSWCGRQFVFPFERFGEAGEHLRQVARRFSRPDETDEDLAEDVGVGRQRLGKGFVPFDASMTPATTPKARVLEGVPQVGESVQDGDARRGQLFEVEAEIDQFAPGGFGRRRTGCGRGWAGR